MYRRRQAPRPTPKHLIATVRWHPAQELEVLRNGIVVIDLPAGSLIEAKRFVLSLGSSGRRSGRGSWWGR
jgi:hypothetical protein